MSGSLGSAPAGPDGVVRGWPVGTPLGVMYMRHVGWGVLVDNSSNSVPYTVDGPYLTVAGRQFTASVGVYPDGSIERQYVSKVGSWSSDDAAPTHKAKIVATAREAALRWIEEHPERVAEGEAYRARMDLCSAEAEMERLKPEYEAAKKRLRAAQAAHAKTQARLAEFA